MPSTSTRRIPIAAYAVAAALAALGLPALSMAAWRSLVWRSPGDPDAVASLWELTAVACALGLLVAGQLVALVQRRREIADAVAAADARRLEAAVRRTFGGVRVAAGAGAAILLAYLAVSVAAAVVQVARSAFDWPVFGLTLALLTGPALAAIAAPAWLVGLRDAGPAGLARAIRRAGAGTVVAGVALGAVLAGATAGFAIAQAACQRGGSAAICGAANVSMGEVAGLVGPAVTLLALAATDRGLRALWTLRVGGPPV